MEKMFEKPIVNLEATLMNREHKRLGSEEISVYGALGCFEEKTPLDLFLEDEEKLASGEVTVEGLEKKKDRIFNETSGRGHGSVLDQSRFTFVIEDLPRIVTLQLCLPQYLDHLQQSLRRAKADRGFYLPQSIKNSRLFDKTVSILNKTFSLYKEMCDAKIPGEDARFILPLYTKTNIQTTGDARELMHLHYMSRQDHIPSIIKETIEEMINKLKEYSSNLFKERATNYEVLAWYPSSQLFAMSNKTLENLIEKKGRENIALVDNSGIKISEEELDRAVKYRNEEELANLKHIHFTFLAPMSLACFHQATRQRTWDQSIEPIYNAIKRKNIVIPPSIMKNELYKDKYIDHNLRMIDLFNELLKDVPAKEAIGVIPHSQRVYDLIHINGWNAIHSIGKRTCNEAQWEIRNIAKGMATIIKEKSPVLGKYTEPQGIIYGRCPEKNSCGYCEAKMGGTLEELHRTERI